MPNKSYPAYKRKSIFLPKNYFSDIDEVHKITINWLFITTITTKTATLCFKSNTLNIKKFLPNYLEKNKTNALLNMLFNIIF